MLPAYTRVTIGIQEFVVRVAVRHGLLGLILVLVTLPVMAAGGGQLSALGTLGGGHKSSSGGSPIDLDNYVTGKTLDGLFTMIGEEEQSIRHNPPAQQRSAEESVRRLIAGSLPFPSFRPCRSDGNACMGLYSRCESHNQWVDAI